MSPAHRVASTLLAAFLPALATPLAHAATTFNINTTAMTSAVDGQCTLVEALAAVQANATVNECVSAAGPYTINLVPGTYSFMTHAHVDGNFGNAAAGVTLADLAIDGAGATLNRGPGAESMRLFNVSGARALTLRNLTISGFNASNTAEPIAHWGGAIAVAIATLSVEDSTFSGNTCGFASVCDGTAVVALVSTVNIHRSTFDDNTSTETGASQLRVNQNSTLNIANSTFSGARIAISTTVDSVSSMSSVTVSGTMGSLILDATGSATVHNSLLPNACQIDGGTLTLINTGSSTSCGGASPGYPLLALDDNGGPTRTRAFGARDFPQDKAPACAYLSTGANPLFANGAAIATDQRGFPRGALCDLGAFESFSFSVFATGAQVDVPFASSITATGGAVPITFAPGAGTFPPGLSLAANGTLSGTPTAGGSYTFDVVATDNAGFTSTLRTSFPIGRGLQFITFPAQVPASHPLAPAGTFAVNPLATSDAGLAVTYSSGTPAVCTLAGSTVTMVSVGTCAIRADQPGNADYFPATQVVTRDVEITAVVPAAPTIGTAVAGNTQVSVSFTPPAFTGGSPIASYTVTCGAAMITGPASPIVVPGLVNGTPYACTVTATNGIGTGPPSALSNVATPTLAAYSGLTATNTGVATASFTGGGPGCSFAPQGNGPLQSAFFIPVSGHPKSPPVPLEGVTFAHGLFDFVLIGCTPGSAVTMTLAYPGSVATTRYFKYGPTPGDPVPHWYVMPATVAGNTVSFTITDGGLGDDDLLPNGTIVDQGGPGLAPGVATPTLSQWLLGILALLLLGIGMRAPGLRGRG